MSSVRIEVGTSSLPHQKGRPGPPWHFRLRLSVYNRLRDAHRDAEEDLVLDVQDLIDGWCAPGARLPTTRRGGVLSRRPFVVGIATGSIVSAALVLLIVLTTTSSARGVLLPALAASPALASLFALLGDGRERHGRRSAGHSAFRQRQPDSPDIAAS